jgi:hypothetical protein
MVAGETFSATHELRLKGGVPPAVRRSMPAVARVETPTVPKVNVTVATAPETLRAAEVTQAEVVPVAFVTGDAEAPSGLAPATRLAVISDVTVHAEPRTGSAAVGTLHRAEIVEMAAREAGWILVRQGRSLGWVWGEFLAPA